VIAGLLGIGTRSGATLRLSGTSTAAQRVARAIADVCRKENAGGIVSADLQFGPVDAMKAGLLLRGNGDGRAKSRSSRFAFRPEPPTA
jgi:hypothetical protein